MISCDLCIVVKTLFDKYGSKLWFSKFRSSGVMFARCEILLLGQRSRGHFHILMQLQVLLPTVDEGYNIFLLCVFIADFTFGRQLHFVFTMFSLNNLSNL